MRGWSPAARGRGLKHALAMDSGVEHRGSPAARGRGLKRMPLLSISAGEASPAARGRGLKHVDVTFTADKPRSPAARGRGLKPRVVEVIDRLDRRPPRAGVD